MINPENRRLAIVLVIIGYSLFVLALLLAVSLPAHGELRWACHFETTPVDCGFQLQAGSANRATSIVGRTGKGTQLTTQPGDNNIAGSGDMERADIWLTQEKTECYEGRDQWWTHSLLLPGDFAMPTWQMYVVMDFHHTGSTGQANVQMNFQDGRLQLRVNAQGAAKQFDLGTVNKGQWYEFVYHVKWSSKNDGFLDAWMNGKRKVSYQGPTLYAQQGCYLKLANYHTPVCEPYPGCSGPSSSVVHDRVILATTAWEVSSTQLEGYPLEVPPPAPVKEPMAFNVNIIPIALLIIALILFSARAGGVTTVTTHRIDLLALALAC